MPRTKSSRLTLLPYDVLHHILSLILPSLPSTVHLNLEPCPSYLEIFHAPQIIPCPSILLVCRLLTRHALRIIYAQTRIVIHPGRSFLTELSVLRARKHVQHIDLAVELRPRENPSKSTNSRNASSHDLLLESFYSPSYLVDLILRTFPKLSSVRLTILETATLIDKEASRSQRTSHAHLNTCHQFPPSSLTQSNSIDASTWNDLIVSLRYKTCQAFTTLTSLELRRASSPSIAPPPTFSLPRLARQGGTNTLNGNDIWRDRTRRLMDIASRYTNTTSPVEPNSAWSVTDTSPNAELDPGDSVTDFILQDENNNTDDASTLQADQNPVPEPVSRPLSPTINLNIPDFVLPLLLDVEAGDEGLRNHLLRRFSPFAPPTLPNLKSVEFYVKTEQSIRDANADTTNAGTTPEYRDLVIGKDGDMLKPKFAILLSEEIFGNVDDVKVRRVVEGGCGSEEGPGMGWEEMHEVDLARIFAGKNEKGKGKGKRRRELRFRHR